MEAEAALATAKSERVTLEQELREGQERLRALREERVQQLRGELGAEENMTDYVDTPELSDLRRKHAKLQAELQSLQGHNARMFCCARPHLPFFVSAEVQNACLGNSADLAC